MIPAYSPEARGRSGRMFSTHQARLPKELALAGIRDMAKANRYIKERYLAAFNREFMQPAQEEGTAFVRNIYGDIDDILCEQYPRRVGKDNCVSFEGLKLQIPSVQDRLHFVKAEVRVHRHPDQRLALFLGPRLLARYEPDGRPSDSALPSEERKKKSTQAHQGKFPPAPSSAELPALRRRLRGKFLPRSDRKRSTAEATYRTDCRVKPKSKCSRKHQEHL
jgi:hypothetical protein